MQLTNEEIRELSRKAVECLAGLKLVTGRQKDHKNYNPNLVFIDTYAYYQDYFTRNLKNKTLALVFSDRNALEAQEYKDANSK